MLYQRVTREVLLMRIELGSYSSQVECGTSYTEPPLSVLVFRFPRDSSREFRNRKQKILQEISLNGTQNQDFVFLIPSQVWV